MDANVCDKDHNPTNCYLTVTTRIVFDRAAEETAEHRSDEIAGDAHAPSLLFCGDCPTARDKPHRRVERPLSRSDPVLGVCSITPKNCSFAPERATSPGQIPSIGLAQLCPARR